MKEGGGGRCEAGPDKKGKKGKKTDRLTSKRRVSEVADPSDPPSPSVLFGFLNDPAESIARRTRRRHEEREQMY
jgi:hypothetical protein